MKTVLCRHCDMLCAIPEMAVGEVAKCSRCQQVIAKNQWCSSAGLLALSITALLVAIPAFSFPLISVHLLGITEETNLLQGALMMLKGAPLVAIVVLFCALIAPMVLIISITLSSACLTFNYYPNFFPLLLKITRAMLHWSMLEVYMVSLMVAVFKLMSYSDLYFGLGFYFFITLLLLNIAIISNYSNQHFWEKYSNG